MKNSFSKIAQESWFLRFSFGIAVGYIIAIIAGISRWPPNRHDYVAAGSFLMVGIVFDVFLRKE